MTLSLDDGRKAPPEAVEAWLLATLPRAVALASSLLKDRARAEDVVHDCYVRLLRKAGDYDLPADGTKLLFKAIANACIDVNVRERRLLSLEELSPSEEQHADPADGKAAEPYVVAAARELERAVADQLARLPPAQRAAIELKSLGYSLGEIAEALSTTAGNAGVLVHRARQALACALQPFLGGRGDE